MNKDKYLDFETSRKIHDACKEKNVVLPESEYVWILLYDNSDSKSFALRRRTDICQTHRKTLENFPNENAFQSFCCQELGVILPAMIDDEFALHIGKNGNTAYTTGYNCIRGSGKKHGDGEFHKTMLNSMGKMLLYLILNGYIK